ncbi:unnamed protein product [Schistosoma mattheei]|uniref:DUF7041 domain-containing protein n=1 Tax=Schistosoma mattheei TaxID=31246 RepID=A0A183Q469_9TREM|nr:unnamed protein product [Schistosoma mattheei]
MPYWPDNIEALFCYAEADFSKHGVIDARAQFLAVVKALPREFNRCVTPSMFASDVSEPYETLKCSILKQEDLTDRQRLDQLVNNIDLQHGSAMNMLQRMREVIRLRTFDEGLFKQLFLSKLPQQVQAVLVSFQNNALDELAASADRILEITKSSNIEVFSIKEKPQTTQNDVIELCNTLTRYLNFRNDRKRSHTPRRSTSRKRSVSRPRETDNHYWCWYHNQYRKSSRNCRKPCNFPNSKHLGKLPSRHALTATVAGEHSRLLYITDVTTRVRYLVDTGVEVSVLPANSNDRLHESALNLQAANGKPIATYGKRYVYLNVGLHKPIHWIFIVADVSMLIIGTDLLQHHNLIIDTRKRRLVDGNTNSSVCLTSFPGCRLSLVTSKHTKDPLYQPPLDKYPGIH